MARINNYNVEKIIDELNNKGHSKFINNLELMEIKGKLHKNEYKIYSPLEESSKLILYKDELPNIILLKINSKVKLRHQDIMGTIYSLGVKEDTFGDIFKIDDTFYFFCLEELKDYFKYNLTSIKNNSVVLEEVDLSIKDLYTPEFEEIKLIVSSLRIDNVISTLINRSRGNIEDLINNKDINLNYSTEFKMTRLLSPGDIFSVRRYGKYKFKEIVTETKKNKLVIIIQKYL
jgi:RNA-binding protein YlmH